MGCLPTLPSIVNNVCKSVFVYMCSSVLSYNLFQVPLFFISTDRFYFVEISVLLSEVVDKQDGGDTSCEM
jgi:hypothetical protein